MSSTLQQRLAEIDLHIAGSAYAFGEDCRQQDGTSTFLAMETDFRVRVPVESMEDEAALGSSIRRVMEVVDGLPAAELSGTRPGRVEFEFYSGADSSLRLIIEIDRYRAEAQDLEGAELFKHFRPAP